MAGWLLPLIGAVGGIVGGGIQKYNEQKQLQEQIDQMNANIERTKKKYESLYNTTKNDMASRAGNIEGMYMLTNDRNKEAGLMGMHNQVMSYGINTLDSITKSLAELEMKKINPNLPDPSMSVISGAFEGLGTGLNLGLSADRALAVSSPEAGDS
jgi:hypothetical protein